MQTFKQIQPNANWIEHMAIMGVTVGGSLVLRPLAFD